MPEKNSKENALKKMLAQFFKSKHLKHHFCPKFHQTCPNFPKKHDLQKNKNVCILIVGAVFVKSKHIQ